eukprot:scaffold16098_cov80-Skeletonema_menzelii.AAC.3
MGQFCSFVTYDWDRDANDPLAFDGYSLVVNESVRISKQLQQKRKGGDGSSNEEVEDGGEHRWNLVVHLKLLRLFRRRLSY